MGIIIQGDFSRKSDSESPNERKPLHESHLKSDLHAKMARIRESLKNIGNLMKELDDIKNKKKDNK